MLVRISKYKDMMRVWRVGRDVTEYVYLDDRKNVCKSFTAPSGCGNAYVLRRIVRKI